MAKSKHPPRRRVKRSHAENRSVAQRLSIAEIDEYLAKAPEIIREIRESLRGVCWPI